MLYGQRQFQELKYLREHVWGGGGGCHLDRCVKREAYASRMKGEGVLKFAGLQRYRDSIGNDVHTQMVGNRDKVFEVEI
jgi:hypothetical protein